MKTKPHSIFCILHSSFALLAAFTLFTTAPLAPAQTSWGSALSLNGANQYVWVNGINLTNMPLTIELWAKRQSSGTWDSFVGQGGGVASQGLFFSLRDNDVAVFSFYAGGLYTTNTYTDSAWHHWAATYDPSTGRRIYQDGVLVAADANTNGYTGNGALYIGTLAWDQTGNAFDGQIDDVRIWNVARSQAEVQAQMGYPLTGAEPNLLAYWKFDEGAGATAADATAHGFNAVLVNGASWTNSAVGQPPPSWGTALSFDGADDYVRTTVPTVASNYTVSAWLFLRAGGNNGGYRAGVLSAANCGASAEVLVHSLTSSYTDPQYLELGRCGSFSGTTSTGTVPINQWVHVAVTVSSNKQVDYFINGSPAGSWNGSALNLTLGPNITLGDNTTRRFNGLLDEVQIWNKARTQAEIQVDMGQRLSGTEPNLVAYYRFDEGAGVTAYDATPNHRNGTLVNRPVRAPSFWSPLVTLNSPNPMTNECHVTFADPTTVNGSLLAIATRRYHGLALRADGTIAGWGAGTTNSGSYPNYGQASAPARATNVVAIAANELGSLVLKADGTVLAWGANFSGETNVPAGAINVVAIAAGPEHNLALRANGTVIGWGANWYGETTIPASAVNVVAIAAAYGDSLALKADGTVIGWGKNNSGETTIPASATNVVAIAAGDTHMLALKADGTVVAWGNNYSGQTTVPPSATNVVAIAAGSYHSLALRADGTVVGWGSYSADDIPADATNVVGIAAGPSYSVALRADGTAVGWGYNPSGESGIPPSVYKLNLPLAANGTVNTNVLGTYVLTYNTTNVLGAASAATRIVVVADNLPPVLTLTGGNPLIVNRDIPFVDPGATATDLCTGDLTGSIVTNVTVNTSVPGSYVNTYTVADASGNVALATRTVVVAAPLVTTLPVSNMINDAATLNGTVNPNAAETTAWFEWRSAYDHDYANSTPPQSLGSGTNAVAVTAAMSGLTPGVIYRYRVVATNSPWVARGQEQVFWSPAVDLHGPEFLTLEYGQPFVDTTSVHAFPQAIAAGSLHSLALKGDGTVVGWGAYWNGQTNAPPGATNVVAIAGGGEHSLALRADGKVVGWGYSNYGQTNSPASATNVVAIAAGYSHSLALKADGKVVGWGNNWYGQTNSPASATNVVAIAAGGYHNLALRADGTVVGWGAGTNNTGVEPDYGQSIIPPGATNVVAIAAGYYHSLALKADGTIVGWGAGTFVADPEDYDYINYGQALIPASATNVVAIAAGGFHNLALKANGRVIGWGDNYYGETTVPDSASNVVTIAAGGAMADGPNVGHSLALKADGTVIGWGAGGPGQSYYPHFGQSTIPPGLNVLSLALGVSGTVNTNVLGTYVLTYNCTNALGAIGTATRTVVVATRPIVTTEPVTDLGSATARLQGTVNPRASETLGWFEYGLGANYGAETPKLPLGSFTNAQPFNWPVTGLLPWMTYHYRAVASNTLGRVDGLDATFTLPGPSMVALSLSALSDITLPQGGGTSVWFTVSPAAVDVRVRCSNPVLLPGGGLVPGGSGTARNLSLVPAPNHSGSAQVTVIASDGSRSASRTFTLTVTPSAEDQSPLLYLADAQVVSTQAWRFRLVDAGTGSTNYAVEYRSDLSPTSAWGPATNITAMSGGVFEVAIGPPQRGLGFYRAKGFRLLMAGFDSADLTAGEGAGTVGPVVVFNSVYVGTVSFAWTDEQGTTWTDQVQVNGTTAVIPIPASFLSDDPGIGQLRSLTLRLEGGTGFALGATTESTVTIEENDANWRGVLETTSGSLGITLTMLQTNGSLQGRIQSEGFGFFPTNALVQLTFREATFAAVATDVCLPVLTGSPSLSFTNYLDLRLDAANGPGVTNVSPTRIQGAATLASKVPGRSYLDSALSGRFFLMKAPTPPATNEVPLYPAP